MGIALADAKQWSEDAEAVFISSTDNHDEENANNGEDGKRRCWTFMFHSAEKDKQYAVYVIDGETSHGNEVSTPHYDTFTMDDFSLDSVDLIQLVQGQLTGGVDWAWGYHYIVQYRYMEANSAEPQLTLSVRGLNSEGMERCMIYDPYSGELLAINDKTGYDENGRSIWENVLEPAEQMQNESAAAADSQENASYLEMTRDELEQNRDMLEEKFSIYETCVEYRFDPEELMEAIIDGITGDYFSPFSECASYEEEEWRLRMEAYYGENWENWERLPK